MNPYKGSTVFADGMIVKRPREGAPKFIKLTFSFKVDEFVKFLKDNESKGWVNCDLKVSKENKLYVSLNQFKKNDLPKGEFDEINQDV